MGRARQFQEEAALEKAMLLFWEKGYEATSLSELTEVMGLSRSSFYDTFGSKKALFISALNRYQANKHGQIIAILEGNLPGKRAIENVFKVYLDIAANEGGRKGCFVSNSAVEMAPHSPEVETKVSLAIDRMELAFARAIKRGQENGAIPNYKNPTALARFLVSCVNGLVVMTKAGADNETLNDIVNESLSGLAR